MSDQQWYIKTKSGQRGPYSIQQLQRYINAGAIRPNAGIGQGDGRWIAAMTVDGLKFSDAALAKRHESVASPQASQSQASQTTANELEDALRTREQTLKQREDAVQQRTDSLDQREQSLDRKAAELQRHQEQLESDRQAIEQREEQLEAQTAQLAQRQQSEQATLEALRGQVEQFEIALKQKEEVVADLNQQLELQRSDRDHEQSLDARSAELDQAAEELEQSREELEESRKELEQSRVELEQARVALDAEREALESDQQALQTQQEQLANDQQELKASSERLAEAEQQLAHDRRAFEDQHREFEATKQQWDEGIAEHEAAAEALRRRESECDERERLVSQREAELERQRDLLQQQQQAIGDAEQSQQEEPATLADDDLLAEKRKLLEEFAKRQELLSRREAVLMRREDELTRRELDMSQFDPLLPSDAPPVEIADAAVETTEVPEVELVFQVDSEEVSDAETQMEMALENDVDPEEPQPEPSGDDGSGSPSTWEQFLQDRPDAPSPPDMMGIRSDIYQQRFGPASDCLVDLDEGMRVDVSVHPPNRGRDFTTLVTNGMSDYPIAMPNGQRSVRAELLLYVTHVDEVAVNLLRAAAKLPYQKKQGLSIGTTGGLDDASGLMTGSKQQDCVYLLPVVESDSKPIAAKETLGSSIQLFWLVTITDAERKLIETSGIHKFLSLLEKNSHAVYFDLMRDCYVKRKGWFRR